MRAAEAKAAPFSAGILPGTARKWKLDYLALGECRTMHCWGAPSEGSSRDCRWPGACRGCLATTAGSETGEGATNCHSLELCSPQCRFHPWQGHLRLVLTQKWVWLVLAPTAGGGEGASTINFHDFSKGLIKSKKFHFSLQKALYKCWQFGNGSDRSCVLPSIILFLIFLLLLLL